MLNATVDWRSVKLTQCLQKRFVAFLIFQIRLGISRELVATSKTLLYLFNVHIIYVVDNVVSCLFQFILHVAVQVESALKNVLLSRILYGLGPLDAVLYNSAVSLLKFQSAAIYFKYVPYVDTLGVRILCISDDLIYLNKVVCFIKYSMCIWHL